MAAAETEVAAAVPKVMLVDEFHRGDGGDEWGTRGPGPRDHDVIADVPRDKRGAGVGEGGAC